MNIGRILMTVS